MTRTFITYDSNIFIFEYSQFESLPPEHEIHYSTSDMNVFEY